MIFYAALFALLAFIIFIYRITKKLLLRFAINEYLRNGIASFSVMFFYFLLLFDQLPFYLYAKYLYSRDGGVYSNSTAHDQPGYMAHGNCERIQEGVGSRFSFMCYFPLFEAPNRTRALNFIEFELGEHEASSPSKFYRRQGAGVYRIQLEQLPLDSCPVLRDALVGVDGPYILQSERELLQRAKSIGMCPVVKKVDSPMSKYKDESQQSRSVVFSDGVHKVIRIDTREWMTLDGSDALYRAVNYCVEGAFILWGKQSDVWPPNPCAGSQSDSRANMDPFGLFGQITSGVKNESESVTSNSPNPQLR